MEFEQKPEVDPTKVGERIPSSLSGFLMYLFAANDVSYAIFFEVKFDHALHANAPLIRPEEPPICNDFYLNTCFRHVSCKLLQPKPRFSLFKLSYVQLLS
jgi:hypothetical protein